MKPRNIQYEGKVYFKETDDDRNICIKTLDHRGSYLFLFLDNSVTDQFVLFLVFSLQLQVFSNVKMCFKCVIYKIGDK